MTTGRSKTVRAMCDARMQRVRELVRTADRELFALSDELDGLMHRAHLAEARHAALVEAIRTGTAPKKTDPRWHPAIENVLVLRGRE